MALFQRAAKGLKGKEIPLSGRVTAIVDVLDALVSDRPYRKAFAVEESLRIVKEGKGTQFDPEVVEALFAVKEDVLSARKKCMQMDTSAICREVTGQSLTAPE